MKIAIDLSPIIYGTGVSHYRENLVKNLLKIDNLNNYLLFGGSLRRKKELEERIKSFAKNQEVKVFPIFPTLADILWNKFHVLPAEKFLGQIDLLHTSDWAEIPATARKLTTIHDLTPILFPKVTPEAVVRAHRSRLKWVSKESQRIIVPSQATKNDLVSFGFKEVIIRVIAEAPNLKKSKPEEVEMVKKKYKIHEDYIIAIGTNPRKNLKRMIEAYHLAKAGKNLKMIVIGEKTNNKMEMERGVRLLGHVIDADLSALLTGSKALVFASLYEGLGVPILDAFNCGVPVVTSNLSSMPEAAGGAAVLVDPYKVNSIAEGISEALSKPKTLIAKGSKRVQEFSWEKCARETLAVYNDLAS